MKKISDFTTENQVIFFGEKRLFNFKKKLVAHLSELHQQNL